MVDSPSGERIAELEAEVQRLRHLVGPSESDYETLRKEVWRLRDEVLGLQGQAGTARGARLMAEANQVSADNRADFLARELAALTGSRQYRAGRWIVGPARRLRRLLRGG